MNLRGHWTKVPTDPCDQRYPDEIEFREATYLARKGPRQAFVIWDAGDYEIIDWDLVKIQIATDEQVVYRLSLADDTVEFVDDVGCKFSYRRTD